LGVDIVPQVGVANILANTTLMDYAPAEINFVIHMLSTAKTLGKNIQVSINKCDD
jgi:hypothetical protein